MPIEYVRDPRTGKLVAKGSLGFGQAVVPEAPPRPRQPVKSKPKPKGAGIFGFGANGFSLDKLGNDLRYELNQLRSDPVRSAQRVIGTRPEAQIALGGATALSNAARAVIEYKQKASGRPKADYTTSPVGRAVDAYEDTVFRALNQTPPSQMTGQEKAIRDMRGSVTLAVATSLGGGALLNAARGVRFIGPAAQALSNITNPGNATTAIGAVGRVAADAVVGELASTPLDDNTGGSAAGLVDMVLGTKLDPVKPGMDRPEAAAAAFGPNALAGFAIAAPLTGLGRWAGHARARSAQRAAQPVQQARAELEAAGLTQSEPESGASAFTPEAAQGTAGREYFDSLVEKYGVRPAEPAATPEPAPQPAAAPAQAMEPGGAVTPGKLPAADPAVDPWEIDYDPSLPEADVALTLVKNASDDELLNALRGDGAVLDQLDQSIASRPPVEPDPALSTEVNGAPTDSLAPPITPFADQWKRLGQKDPNALLAVLHPDVNPALAERAQAMFGRGWEDLTPQDAVDTLQAAAADGMTVMPNRLLPGQQIMRTSDIKPGPKLERAPGSTLKDASQWDNELEGVVDVWKDPASGNYFAVNGRSRLDLAKRTGVNSLVVREVQADSLEQARQLSLQDENAVLTPNAAEPQAAPDRSAIDQPQQLAEVLPEDRPALELAAIQRAIQAGEVRPPETPIPDLPSDSGVDLLKVQRDLADNTITDDVVQALDDELALREQFGEIDRVVAQETEKAARDAVGYDLLTFEEKKQAGMLDGIQEPAPLLRPGTELHHGTQEQFKREILRTGFRASKSEKAGTVLGDGVYFAQNERYARAYGNRIVSGRLPDEARILDLISQNKSVADLANEVGVSGDVDVSLGYAKLTYPQQQQIRQWATSNGYDGIRFRSYDTPDLPQAEIVVYNIGLANKIAGAAPPSAFSFPADLAKSAPRYGMAKVEFASDLDRAAYMLRDSSKKSKGEDRLIKALEEAGYSIPAIRMHGEKVKQALKDAVTKQTGSAAAPQSAITLRVPEQAIDGRGSQVLESRFGSAFDSGSESSKKRALSNYDIWLLDPNYGGSDLLLDVLLKGNEMSGEFLRDYLAKVGDFRAQGVWTIGEMGPRGIVERDIKAFMQEMSNGRADIADTVFVETSGAGYGRIQEARPERVRGAAYDDVNQLFADYLLISRYDAHMMKQDAAELAMVAAHEAFHRLQLRFMTTAQIDQLLTPEAKRYFLHEAEKGYGTEARRMEPIELQAWGSQRVLAARLLFAMESTYRKAGLKNAASYVKTARVSRLGEYSPPPTAVSEALRPLVEMFERIKNYLVGQAAGIKIGFVANRDLSYSQLRAMAKTAQNFSDAFRLYGGPVKSAVDNLLVVEPPIPDSVREVIDAAYTGMISQQPMRGPRGAGSATVAEAESWMADQKRLGIDYGYNVSRLSELVGETGGRPFGRKDFSKEAVAAFENGDPRKMVGEASAMATSHLDVLNARIEAIKQRAAQEGC